MSITPQEIQTLIKVASLYDEGRMNDLSRQIDGIVADTAQDLVFNAALDPNFALDISAQDKE